MMRSGRDGSALAVVQGLELTCISNTIQHQFAVAQEYTPTKDNVVFLIDAQASMFQPAGLNDVEVPPAATGCPFHSFSLSVSAAARSTKGHLRMWEGAAHRASRRATGGLMWPSGWPESSPRCTSSPPTGTALLSSSTARCATPLSHGPRHAAALATCGPAFIQLDR
jgi:hypothetical protein